MLLKGDCGSLTDCCRLVSEELFVGHNTIRKLYNNYTRSGEVELEYQKRGKGSLNYKHSDSQVDEETLKLVGQFVLERAQDGVPTSTLEIRSYLEDELQILLSRSAIRSILHDRLHFS